MSTGTDWMSRAVCVGRDPEIWFTEKTGLAAVKAVKRAEEICVQCPVRRQCRAYADELGATDGVWGGGVLRRPARTSIPHSAQPPRKPRARQAVSA